MLSLILVLKVHALHLTINCLLKNQKLGYILKRVEIHENLCIENVRFFGFFFQTTYCKIHPINILYIRVLLKIGCPDTSKHVFAHTEKAFINLCKIATTYQTKTPTVPFTGFLFGWNVVLTFATFSITNNQIHKCIYT